MMLFIILLTIAFLIVDEITYESIELLPKAAILFEFAGIILIDHLCGRFNAVGFQDPHIPLKLRVKNNQVVKRYIDSSENTDYENKFLATLREITKEQQEKLLVFAQSMCGKLIK